jgi:hypothetical protein
MGGYVGIGTTTPAYTLSVIGNIYGSGNITMLGTASAGTSTISGNILPSANTIYNLGSASFQWANIYTATATIGSITINSTNINSSGALNLTAASASLWKTTGDLTIQSVGNLTASSSNNLIFSAAGTERMRIASTTGYVGIGTASPSSTLSVYGTTTLMGGYVGIGTTSPGFLLDVYRASGATSTIARFGAFSSDTIVVGGGVGKITVGVWDPVYSIEGVKYATYGLSIIGMKEETAGMVNVKDQVEGKDYYQYVVDFNNLETGSDLWLFSKTTNLKQNINKLVVLLSPAGRIKAWYQVDPVQMKLIFYASQPIVLSYRLTAPRFDWQEWSNLAKDAESITGFVIDDKGSISSGTNTYVFDEKNNSATENPAETGFDASNITQSIKDFIKDTLASLTGDIKATGQWVFEKIFVKNAEIENLEVKNGVIIYDKKTGDPYCVGVENGSLFSKKGKCEGEQPLNPDFQYSISIVNPDEGTNQNGTETPVPTSSEEITTTTAATLSQEALLSTETTLIPGQSASSSSTENTTQPEQTAAATSTAATLGP